MEGQMSGHSGIGRRPTRSPINGIYPWSGFRVGVIGQPHVGRSSVSYGKGAGDGVMTSIVIISEARDDDPTACLQSR